MSKATLNSTHTTLTLYEFDTKTGFPTGRIKDNVVGDIDYHPVEENSPGCATQHIYYNEAVTRKFAKNICGEGYMGSLVDYTLPAHTLSASTQEELTALIENHMLEYGQAYANSLGICVLVTYPHTWVSEASSAICELDANQKHTGFKITQRLLKVALNDTKMALDVNGAPIAITGATQAAKLNDPTDPNYISPIYDVKFCAVDFAQEKLFLRKRKDSCSVEGEEFYPVYIRKTDLSLLSTVPTYPRKPQYLETPRISFYQDPELTTPVPFGWYYNPDTGHSYRVTDAGVVYDYTICTLQSNRQMLTTSYIDASEESSPQGRVAFEATLWFDPTEYDRSLILTTVPQNTGIFAYQSKSTILRSRRGWYRIRRMDLNGDATIVPDTFYSSLNGYLRFIYINDNGEVTHYKDILN